jgi:uncharacterized membrane protein HdeD (DUF308 family)
MQDPVRTPIRELTSLWWLYLVTGVLWLIIALVVLRFNTTSIATVGALLGAFLIVAGINEMFTAFVRRSWAWVHVLLGALFIAGGVLAFFQPFSAFWALAAILGLLLMLKGAFDIIGSLMTRDVNDLWWLGFAVGILEVLLAFWVSQQFFAARAVVILVWVGFAAIFRGVTEIALGIYLLTLRRRAERLEPPMASPRAA